ncbi:NUDIX hydrolase [Halobacterium salinarum]|uniref:NUDIX hydrolase n=1 Tax=Halobacterium salinarum TaxID=2242 RepID=UPI0025578236|nr:NUDIX hydrolase [Halobacterium salinarum]MDL0118818.1 NUDIX hydrolase [Halobacterium salinarum]
MTDEPLRATVTQRGVVFAPNDDILVVQRATDGGWELPGGRVDRNEDAVAGLQRELSEETGLTPDVVTPVHTLVWHNNDGNGRFGVYYYCRSRQRSVSLSTEHDDYAWEPARDARTRLSTPQQTAVDTATQTHSSST